MSKAFTRESDDLPEIPIRPLQSSALPPGSSNYLTRGGADRLRVELEDLRKKRAELPTNPQSSGELHALDQRIAYLQQSLQSAVVVEPPPLPWNVVRFGATVTLRELDGTHSTYRLVGVDETDLDRDWVSWCSPISRALLNRTIGERVRLRVPSGEREIEIDAIDYE